MDQNVIKQGNKERRGNLRSKVVYGRIKEVWPSLISNGILNGFLTNSMGRSPV